jgi:hypothetical protein
MRSLFTENERANEIVHQAVVSALVLLVNERFSGSISRRNVGRNKLSTVGVEVAPSRSQYDNSPSICQMHPSALYSLNPFSKFVPYLICMIILLARVRRTCSKEILEHPFHSNPSQLYRISNSNAATALTIVIYSVHHSVIFSVPVIKGD